MYLIRLHHLTTVVLRVFPFIVGVHEVREGLRMVTSTETFEVNIGGMLNARTASEMECPIRLAPTVMPHSNSDNSCRPAVGTLASVQPRSQDNTSQFIQVGTFQSHLLR